MIELKGISKKFGDTQAVKQVSFKVAEKETLVLLGTSGCGKTTTLKMINRLIEPDGGQIFINNENITNQDPDVLRKGIGYVMQNIGLFPHYTIAENIALVPKLLKWDKEKIKSRTQELIQKLHLPERTLAMYPHELSGGQQQRVGLARALVTDPSVLLMDEPFGALDNVTRTSIQKEFKALEELKRKTIVMVTHDVQEAFELADRICLMDKGEVVQIGTPKELLYRPINDFARNFLAGKRLALEFKVINIQDIWTYLPEETIHKGESKSANLSIWEAMELLRNNDRPELFVSGADQAIKSINFGQLTKGFNQYQNAQLHE
ncbi:ABC transporter ATP-binding protein [Pedobacter alluvionis]|uniref:ATP-binding cassette domain-containing protein n=1 Tax=Pedobacter alluvionis TaxID=475253 RepID=A0A497Y015_9SPHI|nr:betaine/proline/choline family ABC transporter ATP-binding protein [Pedobacter alluvionis]RLJ74956.1 osmoprotectant transport system ATP-binding protein [Pedobacter alluvionis]TFB30074.1 ATP-binding cassette domain-containing protein [Pedobacter alluvionis]